MRDGWVETTLGEIAVLTIGKTPPRNEPRYWTASLDRPFCTIADMKQLRVDPHSEGVTRIAEDEGKARRVPAGSLLMSFKLTLGRIGFAARDIFPNEAIVWIDPNLDIADQRYLGLYLEASDIAAHAGRAVKGKTLNSASLRSLSVVLPPLPEQRRIVDLISRVDEAISVAESVQQAGRQALRSILAEHSATAEGETVPIADVCEAVIGGVWGKGPGDDECDVTALNTSLYEGDPISADEHRGTARSLSQRRLSSRQLRPGDIVLERSGGSNDQPVGRVVIVSHEPEHPTVPSDFMRLVRPSQDIVDPKYVFWRLWSQYHEGKTLKFQTQTTSIRNLRIPEYLAQPLVFPSRPTQAAVVALAERAQDFRCKALSVGDSLRALRTALLAELLSGDHQIPESYDRFLEAV